MRSIGCSVHGQVTNTFNNVNFMFECVSHGLFRVFSVSFPLWFVRSVLMVNIQHFLPVFDRLLCLCLMKTHRQAYVIVRFQFKQTNDDRFLVQAHVCISF